MLEIKVLDRVWPLLLVSAARIAEWTEVRSCTKNTGPLQNSSPLGWFFYRMAPGIYKLHKSSASVEKAFSQGFAPGIAVLQQQHCSSSCKPDIYKISYEMTGVSGRISFCIIA
jgi:hypothetical protein